ncbi:IclR family transcriptional regulator [Acuticoccus mangrovi]|uniref:IclR family transcriptional regulator n=1 Tax=Acuticoccus mangrovi TaxID=2796142 RepID=A0A934MCX6_9HYPH|nr:IclR family transcriptional regulator [Acuticoccus mangrovi]MBJ3775737.1 IclR family transcriptional regulator [Acuticoccus mangrovi]
MTEAKGGVQSVGRALTLLSLLGRTEEGMRVSTLAREAGLAVSTTHRLLTTLEQHGFAQFDPDAALWNVGREAFAVGAAFGRRRNFVAPALPHLRRLRDATRETANLGVLEGGRLVTVSQVESREIMRAISPPGGVVPAFCSGMGKAILATWPDAEVSDFIARHGLGAMTAKSLVEDGAAMADIAATRARGYAVDDEEYLAGLRCIAAAVFSPQGEAVCAISVSGLAMRLTAERVPEIGARVIAAAADLTASLGGEPATPPA